MRFTLTLLLLCLYLTACKNDQPIPQYFERYQQRLANVLEEKKPQNTLPNNPLTYPGKRELKHDFPQYTINLLELLALKDCELHVLVSNKNNSLGKVAKPSQHLIYETRFLALAPLCIKLLEANKQHALAQGLQEAVQLKQAHYSQYLWQAIFGSAEMQSFWQQPYELDEYPKPTNLAMGNTLDQLHHLTTQLLAGNYTLNSKQFESLLQHIEQGDGGKLIKAYWLQQQYLTQSNHIVQQRLARKPLCNQGKTNKSFQYLNNVITQFFVKDIQTWSAKVNKRYYHLIPKIEKLEQLLASGETPAYKQWRMARSTHFADTKNAPAKHIEQLKALMQSCYVK